MRILITGAGGSLGRAVIPVLEESNHELRLFDSRPLQTAHDFVHGDIRDVDAVARAVAGVDAVVHGAALHGVHLETWPAQEFWSTNDTGTFNVYNAAATAGVRRVVLASSMAVYGGIGGGEDDWAVRTEESPVRPAEVYGMTKDVAERMAKFYADVHQVSTTVLRLGMFVPETFERYGFRLLFGGVDDRDVGQAVARAVAHEPVGGFAAFNIMADSGLGTEDVPTLNVDPMKAIDGHWPGAADLVRTRGLDAADLVWGRVLFPVAKAKLELGYRPQFDFATFLKAWQAGDSGYYPSADKPRWGIEGPDQ